MDKKSLIAKSGRTKSEFSLQKFGTVHESYAAKGSKNTHSFAVKVKIEQALTAANSRYPIFRKA